MNHNDLYTWETDSEEDWDDIYDDEEEMSDEELAMTQSGSGGVGSHPFVSSPRMSPLTHWKTHPTLCYSKSSTPVQSWS